jgi:hypothetical protein
MLLARMAKPVASDGGNVEVAVAPSWPTERAVMLILVLGKKLHGWAEYHGNENILSCGAQKYPLSRERSFGKRDFMHGLCLGRAYLGQHVATVFVTALTEVTLVQAVQ